MARTSTWTDEMQELLSAMWAQGLSSGMIALEFNKLGYRASRNSIMGRVFRSGLPPPLVSKKKLLPPRMVSQQCKRRQVSPERRLAMSVDKPVGDKAVKIHELEDHHCRAILGYENGEAAKAIYCGEQAAPKMVIVRGRLRPGHYPWCLYHYGRYIQQESSSEQGSRPYVRGNV